MTESTKPGVDEALHAAELPAHPEGPPVLLVQPPVYDTRFPWAKWQQPISLFRYAASLRADGTEVRYLDALAMPKGSRLRREKWGRLDLDGQRVDRWRFGRSRSDLNRELRTLSETGLAPSRVVVECGTTFWWRGVREIAELVDGCFPGVPVEVAGPYAALFPNHAATVAGAVPITLPEAVLAHSPSWDLPAPRPLIGYLDTAGGIRSATEVVEDIMSASRQGITLFAFAEHGLAGRHPNLLASILEEIIVRKPRRVAFVSTGTLSPGELVAHPHLPGLMRQAGFRQLFFADDRDVPFEQTNQFLHECAIAATLCHAAGFRARSDELGAGICLGRAGEDLDERARVLTAISHVLGSVVVWPYQPASIEMPGADPEDMNGKLFPLRERNGATYRDYLNVLGLATVLNAKYREHTFDFLGDSMMARLFRDSLSREAWNPEQAVKGSLQLPAPRPRLRGAA
jgi:hypothetical protein